MITAPLLQEFVKRLCAEEEYEPVEGQWIFRSGGCCCRCTDSATKVAVAFSGRVVGYYSSENRSAYIGNGCCEGHDFALIADRFIVDYWAYRVAGLIYRPVLDLREPKHMDSARFFYGNEGFWNNISVVYQESLPNRTV
jgi:hypothetical protein